MINRLLLLILTAHYAITGFAQVGGLHLNLDKNQLAISGFDPVSYIEQNRANKGKSIYALKYKGAIYYFSSVSNREAFKANPEKYVPAYGGWCAFAMGDSGDKVKIDPETFKIIEGRTYLFYNFFFNNTLETWNSNEDALKKKADQNWNIILTSSK